MSFETRDALHAEICRRARHLLQEKKIKSLCVDNLKNYTRLDMTDDEIAAAARDLRDDTLYWEGILILTSTT